MQPISRLLRRAGVAVAFTALTAPAHALLITQDSPFLLGGVGFLGTIGAFGVDVPGSVNMPESHAFDLFNPAVTPGTLNSVTWVLTDAASAVDLVHRAQVSTQLPFPAQFIVQFDLAAQAGITGSAGVGGLRGTGGLSFNLGAGGNAGCGAGPAPAPPGLGNVADCGVLTHGLNTVASDSLLADPSAFIGVGQFSELVRLALNWSTRVDVAIASAGFVPPPPPPPVFGPGPSDVGGEFQFRGTLTLIYDYTPRRDPPPPTVPLPGTPLLLAAGLLALGAMRRKA